MKYSYYIKTKQKRLTKFYPYTSRVIFNIHTYDSWNESKENLWLKNLWNEMASEISGIHHSLMDNKSVIQFHVIDYPEYQFYIGNYDGKISIGLGVKQHSTYNSRPTDLDIVVD